MTSSAEGGTDSCGVQLPASTPPAEPTPRARPRSWPGAGRAHRRQPRDAAPAQQGPHGRDAASPRPRSFPRRPGQRRLRSPAELPAGAEAVPLLEGLRADRRTDLRQEPAPLPGSLGRGLGWRRPVTARATGRRLLVGAHGAGLLPWQGVAFSFSSCLPVSLPVSEPVPTRGPSRHCHCRGLTGAAGSTRRPRGRGATARPRPSRASPWQAGLREGRRAAPPGGGRGERRVNVAVRFQRGLNKSRKQLQGCAIWISSCHCCWTILPLCSTMSSSELLRTREMRSCRRGSSGG